MNRENLLFGLVMGAMCAVGFGPPLFCQFALGWPDTRVEAVAMCAALGLALPLSICIMLWLGRRAG